MRAVSDLKVGETVYIRDLPYTVQSNVGTTLVLEGPSMEEVRMTHGSVRAVGMFVRHPSVGKTQTREVVA